MDSGLPTQTASAYYLSAAERNDLHETLAQRYGSFLANVRNSGSPYGCIAVDGLDPLADLGRTLEQTVFDAEAGAEDMEPAYGDYEDRSIFFLGVDATTGEALGCLRVITGTAGFGPPVKTMRDVLSRSSYRESFEMSASDDVVIDLRDNASTEVPTDLGRLGGHWHGDSLRLDRSLLEAYHAMQPGDAIFDMATIVIPKHIRAREAMRLSLVIYGGSWRGAQMLNVKHAVTFIRDNLLEDFRQVLGMGWEDLAGLGKTQYVEGDPYLSQPAYAHLEGFLHMLERERLNKAIGREPKAGEPFPTFIQLMNDDSCADLFLLV